MRTQCAQTERGSDEQQVGWLVCVIMTVMNDHCHSKSNNVVIQMCEYNIVVLGNSYQIVIH